MNYKCWPTIKGVGIECACGDFKIGGVKFEEAKRRYRAHALEAFNREQDRWHQEFT